VVSFLLWPLAVLGAVFWVALPAAVLLMACFYPGGQDQLDPEAVRPCPGYDPTNPAAKPCWVTAEMEYCPRHSGAGGGDIALEA